jgi:hypothetical protein
MWYHGKLHWLALGVVTRYNPAWHVRTCLAGGSRRSEGQKLRLEPRAEESPDGAARLVDMRSGKSPVFDLWCGGGWKPRGFAALWLVRVRMFGSAESGAEMWLLLSGHIAALY